MTATSHSAPLQPNPPRARAEPPAYRGPAGFFDEMTGPEGQLRPHWDGLARHLAGLTGEELRQRERQLNRLIRENGVTYNVYSDNQAEARPWLIDPVPMLLAREEAERIGAGLAQRARLWQALLEDFYGPQEALKSGLVPAPLVLGNPRFKFPFHGWVQRPGQTLTLCAADLARAPDGSWWVQADRLDTPAGLGYALENRLLVSRVLPGLFRDLSVRRLQSFVAGLCAAVEALARGRAESPRIVLMSPGPGHATFYEHSFLARNLGFPLVEGADLMVRDKRLFLKSITGTQPVDVVLRFVHGGQCDPLELDYQSTTGVAGLVDVLREGRVATANFPGAGVLETHALPAFLPQLARHFLGEELLLPSVPTWWCGHESDKRHVLAHLDQLVLRPTFPHPRVNSVYGPNLSGNSLDRWRKRVEESPGQFCAQDLMARATTPCLTEGRLEPRHYVLRMFLAQRDGVWTAMPGGLVRVASNHELSSFSLDSGGETKDLWVLSAEAEEAALPPLLSPPEKVQIRRGEFDLPSRVADNFFWMGRYVERTEGQARVLQTILSGLRQEPDTEEYRSVLPLFRYFLAPGEEAATEGTTPPFQNPAAAEKRLAAQVRDPRNPESLWRNLEALLRIAGRVKERLSLQLWQQFQYLESFAQVTKTHRPVFEEETTRLLEDCLDVIAGFHGLVMENMTRGQGWLFLILGRRIERTLVMANLLGSALGRAHPQEEAVLRKLLVCADSVMTYRRRYLTHLHPQPVLDLLLLDPANPRSVVFQVNEVWRLLQELPHHRLSLLSTPVDNFGLRIFSRVGLADLEGMLAVGEKQERPALVAFLDSLQEEVQELAGKLAQQYFAHTLTAGPPRQQRRLP